MGAEKGPQVRAKITGVLSASHLTLAFLVALVFGMFWLALKYQNPFLIGATFTLASVFLILIVWGLLFLPGLRGTSHQYGAHEISIEQGKDESYKKITIKNPDSQTLALVRMLTGTKALPAPYAIKDSKSGIFKELTDQEKQVWVQQQESGGEQEIILEPLEKPVDEVGEATNPR